MNPINSAASYRHSLAEDAKNFSALMQKTSPDENFFDLVSKVATFCDRAAEGAKVPKQLSEAQISSLVSILKLYRPSINKDITKLLPISDLILFAECILLVYPLAKQKPTPSIVENALLEFYSDRCQYTLDRTDILKAYDKFLTSCGVGKTAAYKGFFGTLLDMKLTLKYHPAPSPDNSKTSLQDKRVMLQICTSLNKDISLLFEKFWGHRAVELEESTVLYKQALQEASKMRNAKNAIVSHKEMLEKTERNISRLSKLKLYTHRVIPGIKHHCARLNCTTPNVANEINALLTTVLKANNGVHSITEEVTDNLARHEVILQNGMGLPIKSHQAQSLLELTHTTMRATESCFHEGISLFLVEFQDILENTGQLNDLISAQSLIKALESDKKQSAKKRQTKAMSLNQFAIEQFVSGIKKAYRSANETAVKQIKAFFHSSFKSEYFANQFSGVYEQSFNDAFIFVTTALNDHILSKKPDTWDNILTFMISYFDQFAVVCPIFKGIQSAKTMIKEKGLVEKANAAGGYLNLSLTSQIISKCQALQVSVNLFNQLTNSLQAISHDVSKSEDTENSVRADACLQLLFAEEEAEEAQQAYEKAERSQKESSAITSAAITSSAASAASEPVEEAVQTPSLPSSIAQKTVSFERPKSIFNTKASDLLFNLRSELSSWYGLNPAEISAPDSVLSKHKLSHSYLASLQQLYSNDGLIPTLEMLSQCTNPSDKALLIQRMFHWGYLAQEQAITTHYAHAFPGAPLAHDLSNLLSGLGIRHKSLWTKHANNFTLYNRYPAYHTAKSTAVPFSLKCVQGFNDATAKEFNTISSSWIKDAAGLQIDVLSQMCPEKENTRLKSMQEHLAAFQKEESAKEKESTATVKISEAVSEPTAKALLECEKKLKVVLEQFKKRAGAKPEISEEAKKALSNAEHHIVNFRDALGLFSRFPQQRFMHVHYQLMLSSVKNFAENLGVVLSLQNDTGWYSHSLASYSMYYGLSKGLNNSQKKMLEAIDVNKGDEYPYKHFAMAKEKELSKCMQDLSKFYALSKEAELNGEGALPAGMTPKKISEMQDEIGQFAGSLTDLVAALVNKHL